VNSTDRSDNDGMPELVLISDARVRAINVEECGEPLVDAADHLMIDDRRSDNAHAFHHLNADAVGAYRHLRIGVLRRLVEAQRMLPSGIHLLLTEAFRPPELQKKIYDSYRNYLGRQNPHWDESQLNEATSRWVSPIDVAPHTAGAAVDLTLCRPDGTELDMGTPEGATPEESNLACYTAAKNISAEAAANRLLMANTLGSAGLVNYPTEWWHWSYGDRYWAFTVNVKLAIYGPVDFIDSSPKQNPRPTPAI
jgi:zinc D-Ala-D-Ala dipeptidase